MGLREVAIILIVVLGLYLGSLIWRWASLGHKAKRRRQSAMLREPSGPLSTGASELTATELAALAEDDDATVALSAGPARYTRPQEPDASSFSFDALLEMRQTRHLVDVLRNDHRTMQDELVAMREELAALAAKLDTELRTATHASPMYDEAVGLARRGMDAQAIAERCGISVSEAELVRALAAAPQPGE